jgi:hypothetical protein
MIDVPNVMVSFVEMNDDSLYVLFYNYPKPTLSRLVYNMIPKNYIIYNLEKNAHVESKQYPNVGFTVKCDPDNTIDNFTYPAKFVDDALLVWEYSSCNINNWKKHGKKVFYIPPAVSHKSIYETCYKFKMESLFDSDNLHDEDLMFYGSTFDYRTNIFELLGKFFYVKFFLFSASQISRHVRNQYVDRSKIILNLRSCKGLDGHLNTHRIRYLLGKGKLVISDKSGCNDDEMLYLDKQTIAIAEDEHHMINLIHHFLNDKEMRKKYEMNGFIKILKDTVIDLFEEDMIDDICETSKSFIIQLVCSMEYAKNILYSKMNIQSDQSKRNDKFLWKEKLNDYFKKGFEI